MTDSSTVRPFLLRRRCGLLRLFFDAVDILALVVLRSHHRLPLLGDKWVMVFGSHLWFIWSHRCPFQRGTHDSSKSCGVTPQN
jgi:hypothetical protein